MHTYSGKRWIHGIALFLLTAAAAGAVNLIENPGFEQESSFSYGYAMFWKLNSPDDHGDCYGSAARENWRAHEGQFIATIRGSWAGQGNWGGWWKEVEGHGGTTYKAAGWFYADAAWAAETQEMKLEFWNWDRTKFLGSAVNSLSELREEWTRHEVSAVAPEATESVRLVIHAAGASEIGSLQIDDVELATSP